jgi:hypothetical protein
MYSCCRLRNVPLQESEHLDQSSRLELVAILINRLASLPFTLDAGLGFSDQYILQSPGGGRRESFYPIRVIMIF